MSVLPLLLREERGQGEGRERGESEGRLSRRREHARREIEQLELALALARRETAQLETQLTHTRQLAPPRKRTIPQRLPHILRLPPSQLPGAEPHLLALGSLFRPPLEHVPADKLSPVISVEVLGRLRERVPFPSPAFQVMVPRRPPPRLTGRPTIISASVLMGL
ncbi:hypothetical protein T492DRAFT_1042333 [Pavlovales sp. CCMP2436]|nr:hypothetical protein T492DRAFT_1042333 [Pavlovales sp. CCMP2436]